MAQLLKNGSIRMNDGRILWGADKLCIIDFKELSQLLTPASMAGGGFVGFGGGGRGAKGDQGLQGIQGPPGLISLIQDEGFNLPLQNTLNFIGESVSVVNDPGNGRLNIAIDDLYAASRIVSLDPTEGTDLTIQDAVNNLPPEGGTIFIKDGTYPVSSTISWGDVSITFVFSPGSEVVATGLGANPLFKSLNGCTQLRTVKFINPTCVGTNTAGQAFLELADAGSLCRPWIYNPQITGFRIPFHISDGDATYTVPVEIRVFGGNVTIPFDGSALIQSPNPAGTFAMGLSLYITATKMFPEGVYPITMGWTLNFDGEIILDNAEISFTGDSVVNGMAMIGQNAAYGTTGAITDTITAFGGSWAQINDLIIASRLSRLTFRSNSFFFTVEQVGLQGGAGLVVAARGAQLGMVNVHGQVPSPEDLPAAIDILVGADECLVQGSWLQSLDYTVACIRNAAQNTRVNAVFFLATAPTNTIVDVGAGDFTLGVGNIGVSSGGGMVLGANSRVDIGTGINFA